VVRPEQVHAVPDRVEPVSGNDSRVAFDERRHIGVDLPAPLIWNVGGDEHQSAVGSDQPDQMFELAAGAWQDRLECHGRRRHDRIAYRGDFRP
jgi:hypothetical protein